VTIPNASVTVLDPIFKQSIPGEPSSFTRIFSNSTPQRTKVRTDSAMRLTSELLVEADALLRDAELKVKNLGNTLSPESFIMARDWLEQ